MNKLPKAEETSEEKNRNDNEDEETIIKVMNSRAG